MLGGGGGDTGGAQEGGGGDEGKEPNRCAPDEAPLGAGLVAAIRTYLSAESGQGHALKCRRGAVGAAGRPDFYRVMRQFPGTM